PQRIVTQAGVESGSSASRSGRVGETRASSSGSPELLKPVLRPPIRDRSGASCAALANFRRHIKQQRSSDLHGAYISTQVSCWDRVTSTTPLPHGRYNPRFRRQVCLTTC